MRLKSACLLTLLTSLLAGAGPAHAATYTVTQLTPDAVDTSTGDGVCLVAGGGCTLRAAVQQADADAGADTIVLPAGTSQLTLGPAGTATAATGDLDVNGPLTIQGPPAHRPTAVINGNLVDRIFDLPAGAALTLSGVELTGGSVSGAAGGLIRAGSSATLVLSRSLLSGGAATGVGGDGGALEVDSGADAALTDTAVTSSSAALAGGGATINGTGSTLTALRTTWNGNAAGSSGGALAVEFGATADIRAATFTANGDSNNGGAAIVLNGTGSVATVSDTTIAGNVGNIDDGIRAISGAAVSLTRTLLVNTGANPLCLGDGTFTSGGHNLATTAAPVCNFGGSDVSGVPSALGPLTDNGGSVDTMAPLAGSPAVDGAGACGAATSEARGGRRPQGAACDVGAVELGGLADAAVVSVSGPASVAAGQTGDFLVTVTNHGPDVAQARGYVEFNPMSGISVAGYGASQGSCDQNGCSLGPLAVGASATYTAHLRFDILGPTSFGAAAGLAGQGDADSSNDEQAPAVTVTAAPAAQTPAGTTPAATHPNPTPAVLSLSGVRLVKRIVRAGTAPQVRLRLSVAAPVTLAVQRARRMRACRAATARCRRLVTRWVTLARAVKRLPAGASTLTAPAALVRRLPRGTVRVVLSATYGKQIARSAPLKLTVTRR